jgi:hypothetical protein
MRPSTGTGDAAIAASVAPRTIKRCRACNRMRPISFFWRQGKDPRCKICRTQYLRRWIANHRESFQAWQREYKERNREQIREYHRKYQRRRRALMRAGKWKVRGAVPPGVELSGLARR